MCNDELIASFIGGAEGVGKSYIETNYRIQKLFYFQLDVFVFCHQVGAASSFLI